MYPRPNQICRRYYQGDLYSKGPAPAKVVGYETAKGGTEGEARGEGAVHVGLVETSLTEGDEVGHYHRALLVRFKNKGGDMN